MTDLGDVGSAIPSDGGLRAVLLGVVAPLAVAAAAWVLWRIGDALLSIGPLDRAQFGWGVVIPVWLAVPVVGAFLWRRLTRVQALEAAVGLNLVIGAVAAGLLWRAATEIDCQFGPAISPEARVPQALIVGACIGLGPALGGLIGRRLAMRGPGWMAIGAAGVGFAMIWVTILVAAGFVAGPGCNRPTI